MTIFREAVDDRIIEMSAIKISVLLPVHNEEKYLGEALESLARQKGEFSLEVLAVDDFSTDRTWDVLREMAGRYPFLKPLKNRTRGKNHAFNLACSHSAGQVVTLFAGDDILAPDSLERRLAPLRDKIHLPAISLCRMRTFSDNKRYDGIITPRKKNRGIMSGGAMMMTRGLADMCFPLPGDLVNEDLWIACHVLYREGVAVEHVPCVGIHYRIHDANSASQTEPFEKKNESMHARFIVYEIFLERYRGLLSPGARTKLAALSHAETLRFQGHTLRLMLTPHVPLVEKARFLFYSHPILYRIRHMFFSFFSGRQS